MFELNDLRRRQLASRFILTLSRLDSKVKVQSHTKEDVLFSAMVDYGPETRDGNAKRAHSIYAIYV